MIVSNYPKAIAYISGNAQNPALSGVALFYPVKEGVIVEVKVNGLPLDSGFHGLHIHENGNCKGQGFENTGTHLNFSGTPHPEHTGDLPPLLSNKGIAYMNVLSDRFNIDEIIGRSVVIHADTDDFKTQPSGNSGVKIACGVIRPVS